jgi:hypothetical protein
MLKSHQVNDQVALRDRRVSPERSSSAVSFRLSLLTLHIRPESDIAGATLHVYEKGSGAAIRQQDEKPLLDRQVIWANTRRKIHIDD